MTPNILTTIFNANGNYTPNVLKMSEATNLLGASAKNASRSMSMLAVSEKGVALTGLSFLRGTAGALALGTGLVMAGKDAMDFGQQMGNIATIVDTSTESIDNMGKSVLKMGTRGGIAKPISDLTEGLYYIRSAGIEAADAMNVLNVSGKLAMAGLSSLTDAAKAETSALITFKKQGLSAEQIANSFFLTVKEGKTKMADINESFGSTAFVAANAGVKLQEFNAATAALTNTGLTASEAQVALRGSILAMFKPTGEMTDLLQTMGLTGSDAGEKLITKMGGLVPAMLAVKDAAAKTGANINKAFGRVQGLVGYSALTGNQLEQFRKFYKEQTEGQDALSEAYGKQLQTAAAKWQLFKNQLTSTGVSVGNILLPAMNGLLRVLNPILDVVGSIADNHKFLSSLLLWGGAVYGLNKAFGIYNGLLKANMFLTGLAAPLTGRLTGTLLAEANAAKGAAISVGILNGSWKGLLLTMSRVAAVTGFIYGIWKLMEKKDEAKDKMDVITKHLPAGVDKKKFEDQFQDMLSPGHIPLAKRMFGAKSTYPQETYDTLVQKYYTDPIRRQDSSVRAQDSVLRKQNLFGDQQADSAGHASNYEMPFIAPSDNSKNKTDEILAQIRDILKSNPQAAMQPAYAGNGQSARRVKQSVYPTFSSNA